MICNLVALFSLVHWQYDITMPAAFAFDLFNSLYWLARLAWRIEPACNQYQKHPY